MGAKVFYLLTGLGLAAISAAVACSSTTLVSTILDDAGTSSSNDAGKNGDDDDDGTTKDAGTGGSLCDRYCAQSLKAGCATPTKSDCLAKCESTRSKVPAACKKTADAMLTCGTTATFTCDEEGDATTESCSAESLALLSCLQGGSKDGGGDPPDASDGGGSGGTCYSPTDAISNTPYTGVGPANRCTAAQVDALVNGCFSPSATDATCDAQKSAAPKCFDCFVDTNGGARPYPVYVAIDEETAIVAGYSCLAAVIGKPECAKNGMDYSICQASACSTCSANDYEACLGESEAPGNACSTILGNSCATAFNNASAADVEKCTGTDQLDRLKKIGKQICTVGASK